MRYRIAVEDIEPGHWIAWALDLPGCYGQGATAEEAIAATPEAIAAYYEWVHCHDPSLPRVLDAIEVTEVERFTAHPATDDPDYLVNASFEDDRRPLDYWDMVIGSRLLTWVMADLDETLARIPPELLTRLGARRSDVAGIIIHIATAESWYFGMLGLGLDRLSLLAEPLDRLKGVQRNSLAQLPRLLGDERVVVSSGETWTARKVLRRTLWHTRDHTQHIARLLSAGE